MIRSFIAWLNQRFPQQLVVSVNEYKQMREELAQYNLIIQGVKQLDDRINGLEKNVQRLNTANGFLDVRKGPLSLER